MHQALVVGLRVLIVPIFLAALLGQVIIVPVLAAEMARAGLYPGDLAVPYAAAAIAAIACAEVVAIAIWVLLPMAGSDAIFGRRAFVWVDIIIGAGLVATACCAAVGFHFFGIMRIGQPGVFLVVAGSFVGSLAFSLLMVVMRGLLTRAAALHSELAEVV